MACRSLPLVALALLLATLVCGCKDFPGADGRYASGWPRAGPGPWAP
jgi:hypothetical protein